MRLELQRGGFGKLPTDAEFIHARCEDRSVQEFERWLQAGIFHARRELGVLFEECYDSQLDHFFVYRPDNCGQTVSGILRASWDSVGRRFPFVVFGLMPSQEWDRKTLELPLLHEEMLASFRETLAGVSVRACEGYRPLQEWLTAPGSVLQFEALAETRYDNFLKDVECDFLTATGGPDGADVVRDLMLLWGSSPQDPRRFSFSAVLPLTVPAQSLGLLLRFWIELCQLMTSRFPPTLSLFLPLPKAQTEDAALHLSFRPPVGELLGSLLTPSLSTRHTWRPGSGQPPPGLPRFAGEPPPIEGSTTLWEVLQLAQEWPRGLRRDGAP